MNSITIGIATNKLQINNSVPVVLTSISINGGASTVNSMPVTVTMTYTGTPTHYAVSEDSSFTGSSYIAFESSFTYTFTSYGSKTLYVKIKDATSVSSVLSATITYNLPTTILIANISTGTTDSTYGYINSMSTDDTADTTYKDTTGTVRCTYQAVYYHKADYLTQLLKYDSTVTAVVNQRGNPAYAGTPTMPSTEGMYPTEYIYSSSNAYGNSPGVWAASDGSTTETRRNIYGLKDLTAGTYQVRLLLNSGTFRGTKLNIKINNATTQTITTDQHSLYESNNTNFLTFSGVTVDSDGYLVISGWDNGSNQDNVNLCTSFIAFIEIIRTA